eukprot:4627266-Amphidinium_carterae.2
MMYCAELQQYVSHIFAKSFCTSSTSTQACGTQRDCGSSSLRLLAVATATPRITPAAQHDLQIRAVQVAVPPLIRVV